MLPTRRSVKCPVWGGISRSLTVPLARVILEPERELPSLWSTYAPLLIRDDVEVGGHCMVACILPCGAFGGGRIEGSE